MVAASERRWAWAMLALVSSASAAEPVSGGEVPTVSAQRFRASVDAERFVTVDEVEGASGARLLLHYANDPLVYQSADGARVGLLTDVLQGDLVGRVGLGPLRVGLVAPLVLFQQGSGGQGAGVGDVGLDGRWVVVSPRRGPLGVGLAGRVTAPTSSVGALGERAAVGELTAVVERDLGPVRLAANVGAAFGPSSELENVVLDDALAARAAAAWSPGGVGVAMELGSRSSWSGPLVGGATWAEWLASGWVDLAAGFRLRAGAGSGLTNGIGSPDVRAVASLGWAVGERAATEVTSMSAAALADGDGDGLLDVVDACPQVPEDLDDAVDTDGCPEALVPLQLEVTGPEGELVPIARTTVADRVGGAELRADLYPGTVEITVDAPGYAGAVRTVELAGPTRLTIRLQPAPTALVVDRERITFREPLPFDGVAVAPGAEHVLDEVGEVLVRHLSLARVRIEVPGDPARGEAVRAALVARGVSADRVTVGSPAESVAVLIVEDWRP